MYKKGQIVWHHRKNALVVFLGYGKLKQDKYGFPAGTNVFLFTDTRKSFAERGIRGTGTLYTTNPSSVESVFGQGSLEMVGGRAVFVKSLEYASIPEARTKFQELDNPLSEALSNGALMRPRY